MVHVYRFYRNGKDLCSRGDVPPGPGILKLTGPGFNVNPDMTFPAEGRNLESLEGWEFVFRREI